MSDKHDELRRNSWSYPKQTGGVVNLDGVVTSVNGVTPDPNGNVEVVTSWNDLEDRPFSSEFETVSTMLLEEQQVTLMTPGMSYPYARKVFDVSISKEDNTMFVVTLDGIKYEPKRRSSANSYLEDKGSIGNGALLNDWVYSYEPRFVDEDTGEPFGIVFDTFDSFTIYVPISSGVSKTVTLAIEQIEEKEVVKPIDPKFIASDAVSYNQQELTEEQQTQARSNIGAISLEDIPEELPAVSSSNNGQFLRVVDGAWAATSLPSAEEVSF